MPRPKTKLRQGSTEFFPVASWQLPEFNRITFAVCANEAPDVLALVKPAERFLKRHFEEFQDISKHLGKTEGCDGTRIAILVFRNFFDLIIVPQGLSGGSNLKRWLYDLLTSYPEFTLGYLSTLHRAFVKHRKKPAAFHRAIIALREKKPIVDSYGKQTPFETATDQEICNELKLKPALFKQAKRFLKGLDGVS